MLNTIVPDNSYLGKFAYDLPTNVIAVNETALYSQDFITSKSKVKLTRHERDALLSVLMQDEDIDWYDLFELFRRYDSISVDGLLMGPDFLDVINRYYAERYPHIVFSDFLWTMRSLFMPLFNVLKSNITNASLFHSFSTGYAGVLASFAKDTYPETPLVITEHGIYTREREEEIIKTDWAKGVYKDIWISSFYKQSRCAYTYADKVTSLYEGAREIQIELGCKPHKTAVLPNGVDVFSHDGIPLKEPDDEYVNVGAVVRLAPIKDVKTMINSFYRATQEFPKMKLFIIGPTEENPEYYNECVEMVNSLDLDNVIFTGRAIVKNYIGKMDIILLTSISESQPLILLEGMSARKPCIATSVGCCEDLLHGADDDNLGSCGIICPIMQVDAIANAIVRLAKDEELRLKMGEIGRMRAEKYYQHDTMLQNYYQLYRELLKTSAGIPTGKQRQLATTG